MARTRATGSRNSGQTPLPNTSSSIPAVPPNPPIIPPTSAVTGDIAPPHRPVHEDSSSPYFLNSGDNPGLTLVTPLLSDKNFQSWRRDFELSVGARNKTVFLKGTLPQPPINNPLHHHWLRCNQMVMSWILHSVSPDIKSSIMFLDTAAEMWQELNSRYDQGNGPRIFELRETLITLHQGDGSKSLSMEKRSELLFGVIMVSLFKEGDGAECWSTPGTNSVKINVDAALFEDERGFGIGAVARDDKGLLIEGVCKDFQGKVEPLLAEAIGVKEALSWIKLRDWQQVLVEADCMGVVQALRSSLDMVSLFGCVINDCNKLLFELRNASVFFVKRSANKVAHAFAKASLFYPDRIFPLEDVPVDLLPSLVAEFDG
uniref:RNase H type-1 domain-containing protein n=1 Tax=Cannabis sativa TaxID=3483 RepID=A0A803NRL8_CANSA